jgi:hypothetical protein
MGRFVCPLLAVLLSACAGWQHPTANEAQFHRDRYECQMQTASAYPTTQTAMGTGYQAPTQVNCSTYGTQTNCTARPGVYVPPPTQDTNAIPRAFAFDSCMRGRGYTK